MPSGQFSHFRDKWNLIQDTVGQLQDDPGHSGKVGKPNCAVHVDLFFLKIMKIHKIGQSQLTET